MTKEEIIEMAREVWSAGEVYIGPSENTLAHFAALVKKREASFGLDVLTKLCWRSVKPALSCAKPSGQLELIACTVRSAPPPSAQEGMRNDIRIF